MKARSVAERIATKYVVDEQSGCWLWTGATVAGYGVVWVNETKRAARAHRVMYELKVGPIPDGMTLDHLCRTPACINPAHMDPCTAGENASRSPDAPYHVKARATHCAQGHEFTPENTAIHHGRRSCRKCVAAGARRRRAKARAAQTTCPNASAHRRTRRN